MQAPKIQTAIPKRRYRLGAWNAVVLGEIESPDPARYHYILALVREGETQPSCYVTCEKNRRAAAAQGSHRLRVISAVFNEEVGSSDDWAGLDAFATEALGLAARVLGIEGAPERVM
jgi:hypothetical protein